MATYLKFHELNAPPFERSTGSRFVLATEALRTAYAEIKGGLEEGSPRICLSGGAGIGKSSLAAALPKLLDGGFRCVLVRDPSVPWDRLKAALIRQLALPGGLLSRSTLEQTRAEGRRIVIVVDQAEKIEAESLEHLDVILGYKSESGEQLVQCVLLANLEAAPRGQDVPLLWWLDQLTTLQLQFSPIPLAGLRAYVDKHLKKAGWKGQSLFTDAAIVAIHRYTGGIPGTVGALCEELLGRAAAKRVPRIDEDLVRAQFEPEREPGPIAEPAPTDTAVVRDPPQGEKKARTQRAPHAAEPSNTGRSEEFAAPGQNLRDDETTAWPELGPTPPPRAAAPPPRPDPEPTGASIFDAAPEPEESTMKIEQGFVPMEEPRDERPELESFQVQTASAWAGPRSYAPASERGRGRIGRAVRLFAVVSLTVVAAYLYWPADAPIPRPKLDAMIPPPKPVPEALDAAEDAGLTADLRVPDTSATKPRPARQRPSLAAGAAPAASATDSQDKDDPAEGTSETLSAEAEAEALALEPWAAQQPEPELPPDASEAAVKEPVPASPAPVQAPQAQAPPTQAPSAEAPRSPTPAPSTPAAPTPARANVSEILE